MKKQSGIGAGTAANKQTNVRSGIGRGASGGVS